MNILNMWLGRFCTVAVVTTTLCFIITRNFSLANSARLACLDEAGNHIDWFIAYKFPKLKANKQFSSGYAYSYISNSSPNGNYEPGKASEKTDKSALSLYRRFREFIAKNFSRNKQSSRDETDRKAAATNSSRWSVSDHLLTDQDSIVVRTLAVAYDEVEGKSVNSVYYNDEPAIDSSSSPASSRAPKRSNSNSRKAHAKGVLLIDEDSGQGVWLTHSVPKFPPNRSQKFEFPSSSVIYGQTLMCISFDVNKSGEQIVDHLINMQPQVYDHVISEKMLQQLPELRNLVDGNRRIGRVAPTLSQKIYTSAGQELNLYSKSTSFANDIYAGYIDRELNTALYVETWRRGRGDVLNSTCPTKDFRVNNVVDLKYDSSITWSYMNDHSKWAISEEQDAGVVCIGDSNRMRSQFKRGGGAVCLKCPTCWSVFSNTILDTEPCPIPNRTLQSS